MKIAVTGGAGFIGSNLVRALSAAPPVTQVVVVDDLSTGARDNVAGPARFVEGTILSDDHLDEAFAGAASVVHLAAIPSVPRSVLDPLASHEANATGTVKVLEAARRHDVGQVILASSSSVYGANPELPKHEGMRPMPLSPYAVSKLATEAYALAYSSCYGLPVLPFRFFNVFGPGQPADHAYAAVVPGVRLGRAGRPAAAGLRGRRADPRLHLRRQRRRGDRRRGAPARLDDGPGQPRLRIPDLAAGADRGARGRVRAPARRDARTAPARGRP